MVAEVGLIADNGEFMPNNIGNAVRLSNGAILKVKPVPMGILSRAAKEVKKPAVPQVYIEGYGTEEVLDDPEYNLALDTWALSVFEAVVNAFVIVGTQVHSIPPDMHPFDSPDWSDELELLNIAVDRSSNARANADYKMLYVIPAEDRAILTREAMRASSTMEATVIDAVEWFQRREKRNANTRTPNTAADSDWNPLPTANNGDSIAIRGNGSGPSLVNSMESMVPNTA